MSSILRCDPNRAWPLSCCLMPLMCVWTKKATSSKRKNLTIESLGEEFKNNLFPHRVAVVSMFPLLVSHFEGRSCHDYSMSVITYMNMLTQQCLLHFLLVLFHRSHGSPSWHKDKALIRLRKDLQWLGWFSFHTTKEYVSSMSGYYALIFILLFFFSLTALWNCAALSYTRPSLCSIDPLLHLISLFFRIQPDTSH